MVPSSFMSAAPQFASATWGLAAVLAWGTSDFCGGYATRRANAFVFTAVVNLGGLVLVGALAAASRSPLPAGRSLAWALAGGISGGGVSGLFYRALSTGRMGLTAPVAAVLSAAIPAFVSIFTEGLPGRVPILGFFFAALGLWLITRTEDGAHSRRHRTRRARRHRLRRILSSAFARAGSRLASMDRHLHPHRRPDRHRLHRLAAAGSFSEITAAGVRWAVLTGCVDSFGTMLFVRASQTGRLDEAVVISSLYPAVTVLLARMFLKEHFTRWRFVGLLGGAGGRADDRGWM